MNRKIFDHPYISNAVPDVKATLMRAIPASSDRKIFNMVPDHLLYHAFKLPAPILDEYSLKRHTQQILSKKVWGRTKQDVQLERVWAKIRVVFRS
jgi:hypothetical protein